MPVNPDVAAARVAQLTQTLGQAGPAIGQAFAAEVLVRAQARAARRPTPQAPIVASALRLRRSTVYIESRKKVGHRRTPAGKIAAGSEFGALRYAQFHATHTTRGYWLYPARDEVDADLPFLYKMDRSLEGLLNGVESGAATIQLFQQILRVVVAV